MKGANEILTSLNSSIQWPNSRFKIAKVVVVSHTFGKCFPWFRSNSEQIPGWFASGKGMKSRKDSLDTQTKLYRNVTDREKANLALSASFEQSSSRCMVWNEWIIETATLVQGPRREFKSWGANFILRPMFPDYRAVSYDFIFGDKIFLRITLCIIAW